MARLLVLILVTLAIQPTYAEQGGASTGGGGAYVCRDRKGHVVDSELLDLWEARERRKWDIPYTNESVTKQLDRALTKLKKIDSTFHRAVVEDLKYVRENVENLPANQSIQAPNDALAGYYKTGCPLEGMMLFDGETRKLSVKPEIFSKLMNKTNVAAAWMHEAVYKTLRRVPGHSDSRNARKLTSCLFARNDCFNLKNLELPKDKKVYRCLTANRDISVYFDRVVREPGVYPKEFWKALIHRVGANDFEQASIMQFEFWDMGGGFQRMTNGPLVSGTLNPFGYRLTSSGPSLHISNISPDRIEITFGSMYLAANSELIDWETVDCPAIN